METGIDNASMRLRVSQWYALNPDIRRLWVYEGREHHRDERRDVHVVVAVQPVCDSDEIGPIWLARSAGWQRELQRLMGRPVRLDWLDEDIEQVPCAEDPRHARVCLASLSWRHIE